MLVLLLFFCIHPPKASVALAFAVNTELYTCGVWCIFGKLLNISNTELYTCGVWCIFGKLLNISNTELYTCGVWCIFGKLLNISLKPT